MVAVEYTLWLYRTSSGLTATTKGLDISSPPTYHGMQADEICDVSGVLELSGGGGIHSLVVPHILRFDSDNKGTGYAGSIVVARVLWDARRYDL